jgi:hypothetical protein
MATVYIAPTAQGLGDGTSAANAYAYSSLNSAESDASNGGTILFLDGTYTFSGTQTWDAGGFSDMTYKSLNDNGAYLLGSGSIRQIYIGGNAVSTLKVEGFKSGNVYYRGVLNAGTDITLNKVNHADTISGTRGNYGIFASGSASNSNVITNSSFSLDYSGTDRLFVSGGGTNISSCTFHLKCSSVGSGGITSLGTTPTATDSIFMSDNSSAIADSVITTSTCTNCCVYQMHTNDSSGGTNNIFVDPQFVDSANGDLRLRPSSPCIGAGTAS